MALTGSDATPAVHPAAGAPERDAQALEVVALRHPGRWVGAAVIIAIAAAFLYALATSDNIRWATVGDYLFDPRILEGVRTTLILTVLAMAAGIVLGTVLAVMRLSVNPVLRTASGLWIWAVRGTPLLVQIVFWFNLALLFPRIGVGDVSVATNTVVTSFVAALLGLALNESAYMAEIVRGGILSVDHGQTEAAEALGMRPLQVTRRVVLPQAMRVIVPPTGNEVVDMLKATSLVSVIAASDLLTNVQNIYSRTFEVIELLIVASLWYLALTSIAGLAQRRLERRFARGARS